MRVSLALALSTIAILTASSAQAMSVTARVIANAAAVHTGPGDNFPILSRLLIDTEIPVDECTQVDSDSRFGSWGDAGYPLWGAHAKRWCHIPDYGWIARDDIAGRGLVNVTPPDFSGPGW